MLAPEDDSDSIDLKSASIESIKSIASSTSGHELPAPFTARYLVKLMADVTKDGDAVKYSIKSIRVEDMSEFLVYRQYEDFEYLDHCLTTAPPTSSCNGLIIPPLPPRPAIVPESVEQKSRRQLGAESRTLLADEFHKDRWLLQAYLQSMLSHPVFGRNEILDKFLTHREPPARAKVKRGLGMKIKEFAENYETKQRAGHHDCDEFFQEERNRNQQYLYSLKEASDTFNAKVFAKQSMFREQDPSGFSIADDLFELICLLSFDRIKRCLSPFVYCTQFESRGWIRILQSRSQILFTIFSCHWRLQGKPSIPIDHFLHISAIVTSVFPLSCSNPACVQCGLDVNIFNDESTLGCTLDWLARYMEAERDMLLRRTSLLVDYENANRALERAKPQRREEVKVLFIIMITIALFQSPWMHAVSY